MKKLKILFTTSFYPPYHVGGDAVHVKYLAEALAKKGHEVHVLHSIDAYNFKKKEKKNPEKPKKNIILHTLRSPLGNLEPILNFCVGTQKYTMSYFRELVEKEKFDVVHHHNISLLGYNILKKIGPYKNLYTAHDYWLICHKYDMLDGDNLCQKKTCFSCCLKNKKIYQFFRNSRGFREAVNDIDAIIAPSKFMGDVLKKDYKNVKVINNFISNSFLSLNTKKIGDYFIFAGVIDSHKGILNLVKVFSTIDKRLLVVGTGELEAEIKLTLAAKKIKNIELLGWKNQNDLFPLIGSAQALIMPSVWPENNPLIALESLSLGTPLIGSTWGGIPEIVEKVDNKLIFKDLKQLKKIILTFDRRKYNPDSIKRIYETNFSREVFFKKYFELINVNKKR